MTVKEIANKLDLTEITKDASLEKEVTGCYIGDLLSLVMSRAKKGDAWITIQGNVNVPAVALLTECAMIILAESMTLDENALIRAQEEEIPVFTSGKSAYELACEIKECL